MALLHRGSMRTCEYQGLLFFTLLQKKRSMADSGSGTERPGWLTQPKSVVGTCAGWLLWHLPVGGTCPARRPSSPLPSLSPLGRRRNQGARRGATPRANKPRGCCWPCCRRAPCPVGPHAHTHRGRHGAVPLPLSHGRPPCVSALAQGCRRRVAPRPTRRRWHARRRVCGRLRERFLALPAPVSTHPRRSAHHTTRTARGSYSGFGNAEVLAADDDGRPHAWIGCVRSAFCPFRTRGHAGATSSAFCLSGDRD